MDMLLNLFLQAGDHLCDHIFIDMTIYSCQRFYQGAVQAKTQVPVCHKCKDRYYRVILPYCCQLQQNGHYKYILLPRYRNAFQYDFEHRIFVEHLKKK